MAFQNLKGTGIGYLLGKLKTYLDNTYQKIIGAVLSVNGEEPDNYGNVQINRVNMAGDLESSQSQNSNQTFIQRTSGGAASIVNGDAWLSIVRGNSERTGYVAEQRNFTVNPIDEEAPISATIDWDTFLTEVTATSTITFTFTTAWSLDPSTYGITVSGTPANGDEIIVEYVKEERGLITNATPESFISTGWNLYRTSSDYTGYTGYAKVVKYSDDYGYMIKGSRTGIQFSATLGGEKIALADVDGLFQIPSDGYVWVVGGSSADTAIYPTWSDWTANYDGDFTAYSQSVIDLSNVMDTYFPNGLCKVESTYDEINISLGTVTARIEQQEYTEDNLTSARASGRAFTYDTDYIYIVKESITPVSISGLSGQYSVNDHGLEYFEGTTVAVDAQTIYGANLKNKLERDVLTKSQQTLSGAEQNQVRKNIRAAAVDDVTAINNKLNGMLKYVYYSYTWTGLAAGSIKHIKASDFGISTPSGYEVLGIGRFSSGTVNCPVANVYPFATGTTTAMSIMNASGATQNNKNASIGIIYVKKGFK